MDVNFLKTYKNNVDEYNNFIDNFNAILTKAVDSFKTYIFDEQSAFKNSFYEDYNEKHSKIDEFALIFDNLFDIKNTIQKEYFRKLKYIRNNLTEKDFNRFNELFQLKQEKKLEDFTREIKLKRMEKDMQIYLEGFKPIEKVDEEYIHFDERCFKFESNEEKLFVEYMDWFANKENPASKIKAGEMQNEKNVTNSQKEFFFDCL